MNNKAMRLYSVVIGALLLLSFVPLLNNQEQQAYADNPAIGVITTQFFINGKLVDWSETLARPVYYDISTTSNVEELKEIKLRGFIRTDKDISNIATGQSINQYYIRYAEAHGWLWVKGKPFGAAWTGQGPDASYYSSGITGVPGSEHLLFEWIWTDEMIKQSLRNCTTKSSPCDVDMPEGIGFSAYGKVLIEMPNRDSSMKIRTTTTAYAASMLYDVDGKLKLQVIGLNENVPPEQVVQTCDAISGLFGLCQPDQIPITISAQDVDNDGIINTIDPDIDNDGTPNTQDIDIDGDGIPNTQDKTIDGNPLNDYDSLVDTDNDGIPNIDDLDIDGDGKVNNQDSDMDGDLNPNLTDNDVDGDGILNQDDPDIDNDGVTNSGDLDVDGDGLNNVDDPDIDGDGTPNRQDFDMDGDGILNQFDPDMDGDSVPNKDDDDVDNDGVPNDRDTDIDGDNVENTQDETPNGAIDGDDSYGNFFGENTMPLLGSIGLIAAMIGAGVYLKKRR